MERERWSNSAKVHLSSQKIYNFDKHPPLNRETTRYTGKKDTLDGSKEIICPWLSKSRLEYNRKQNKGCTFHKSDSVQNHPVYIIMWF